ncbi:hypothetical protein P170DRAFT_471506 [Aspergillus steynii IBT 23096]|uniref:Uncharacterized protein n=1 Tax=Aspergillus steynii IBT 23096 TaxID=1392250 RepID=A0A2I2GFB5_9EURO|nr:uncharacterized protein P170DRAFT_471506 [Aspergillus steynii IBT 23096]PLB51572.1 hypothetical protein P170DRAFT_471506 [Aspergillus steynii IBT 23096]
MKGYMALAVVVIASIVGAVPLPRGPVDDDEAVVYPARVDQSWVDVEIRSPPDADDAVVYPARVDQSWVDAKV